MRRIPFCAAVIALAALAWGAAGATPSKKKAPAKTGKSSRPAQAGVAAKKKTVVSSRSASATTTPKTTAGKTTAGKTTAGKTTVGKTTIAGRTASRTGKKTPGGTTWRNRQMAPSPERYKEIQDALVVKGYLSAEDAKGSWSPASTQALKRFQGEQNLDPSGRINSLSLIALGLGPKRDTTAVVKPSAPPAQMPEPGPGR